MFTIDLLDAGVRRKIAHKPGDSLLTTLLAASVAIRTGCQKIGACALCKVIVSQGNAGPVTVTEELHLGHRIMQGVRLACQAVPEGDLVVELFAAAPPVNDSDFLLPAGQPGKAVRAGAPEAGYGVALDIGTTNISLSVFSWENGQRIAMQSFANPQRDYGTDVVARLLLACEDEGIAANLHDKLLGQIRDILQKIAQTAGFGLRDITALGVVGNTAMLALFQGHSFGRLLDPKCWQQTLMIDRQAAEEVKGFLGISPATAVEIFDPLAGFVGSDLLAGISATGLLEKEPGTLYIDFGTNSEIALWDGQTVWVTAASGGPAFEGCGLSAGIGAVPGAIYRVSRTDETGRLLKMRTIGDKAPVGICGSAYIDITRYFLDRGLLDRVGRFPGRALADQEIIIMDDPLMKLTKKDVDTLQRAKAAVSAGIRVLLARAGLPAATIGRIFVAGNFGRYLDIGNAQRIGLLPPVDLSRVHICGNAALRGCENIMRYQAAGDMLAAARQKSRYINLAFDADFEDEFVEGLYLEPFAERG